MADNKASLESFASPTTRARLKRSMTSTPKKEMQQAQQAQQQPPPEAQEEEIYFPGEEVPVKYQNPDELPVPNGFMNENMANQIANWEKNYVLDEEQQEQNPEDNEQEES